MVLNRLGRTAPVLALIAAGFMATLSGCEVGGRRPAGLNNHDLLSSSDVSHAGFTKRWERSIALINGETVVNAWRVSDTVFIATSDRILYSINASSGYNNWFADVSAASTHIYKPQISAGNRYVYVVTGGRIITIDKVSGEFFKAAPLRFSAACDPVVVNWESISRICVGGANKFYGLFVDPLAGYDWNIDDSPNFFRASPVYAFNGLFIASSSGKLWRINVRDGGRPDWKDRQVNGPVTGPLTADAARLLVPCADHQLYCFEAASGTPLWEAHLEGTLDQQAMITSTAILCVGSGKGLYGINIEDGKVKWTLPNIATLSTKIGDHVVARDTGGNFLYIVADTGEVDATIPGSPDYLFVRNDLDSTVYVVSADGRVAAYELPK